MSSIRGNSIRDRISDTYEKSEGYMLYDITEGTGLELDEVDSSLTESLKQFDVDNLTGDDLTKYVYQRKGVTRKAAGYAVGIVTVTGTGVVSTGDLFETENGVQFAALEEVNVVDSGDVPVQAVVGGNVGMVGIDSITDMPVTIAGISSCTNNAPTEGGYDAEDDDDLRERFYEALRSPSGNGNKSSYKAWAKQVTGVGDAKVFPLGHGIGTVDVVILDADKTPAETSLVNAVQEYIDPNSTGIGDGVAPIGATCYVSTATGLNINVSASVTTLTTVDTSAIENEIKKAIVEYLKRIAFASDKVSLAQVGNAILDVEGVVDYENLKLNNVTGNVTVGDRQVAILGNVVITWAS